MPLEYKGYYATCYLRGEFNALFGGDIMPVEYKDYYAVLEVNFHERLGG